jgi:SAM-dependent methyltransferase
LNATISYYERNADQFYQETVHADMSALYKPFLALVAPHGKILDAGCGSGRDSLYFIQHGYKVEAFDACPEMCRLASNLIGQRVHIKTFDEVDWKSEFDGIWACASLLHVRRDSIDAVLDKMCHALTPDGTMYLSFKLRDGEWEQEGRFFNGYSVETFRGLIGSHQALHLTSIWVSNDARPSRNGEQWLNSLLRRASD